MLNERVTSDRPTSTSVSLASLDGLTLHGTLVQPSEVTGMPLVLVHGGGVTREEGGFFARIAAGLGEAGRPSLRFDLRGHGESAGRQEELTLAGVLNDVRAASEWVMDRLGSERFDLLGASFGGGICAYYSAAHPEPVRRLVLINPLVNYKKRFVDDKPYWTGDRIDADAGEELAVIGFLQHSPTFKLGRPLLNEVFYLRPHEELGRVRAPTLVVHGTRDTFIPVDSSREAVTRLPDAKLLEIEGAQHGIAVHDDPQYLDPQTQQWQALVVREVVSWLSGPMPTA